MFQEFERRYQELGVETIYLEVRESNEANYQFYLKMDLKNMAAELNITKIRLRMLC